MRGTAPVTRRYTRYAALHPIRTGVMPTDRVHDPITTSTNAELPAGFNLIGKIQPDQKGLNLTDQV